MTLGPPPRPRHRPALLDEWYVEGPDGYPDLTTETILRIDAELLRAEQLRRRTQCEICEEPGIHVHALVGQSPLHR